MKVFALLAAIFFKWSVLGVPLWISIALLAPLALALAYWYRRLKRRSEDSADAHGDSSDGEDDTQ